MFKKAEYWYICAALRLRSLGSMVFALIRKLRQTKYYNNNAIQSYVEFNKSTYKSRAAENIILMDCFPIPQWVL